MGHGKSRGLGDCRMGQQHLIDFPGRDLLAAAIDNFLDPARDKQIAIGVQIAFIAGVKPSADEGPSIFVREILDIRR